MHFVVERIWTVVTSVLGIYSFSPLQDGTQDPILVPSPVPSQVPSGLNVAKGPHFQPPGSPEKDTFECKYPAMTGWEMCSTPTDRKCWLRRTSDGKQYDINTNYEVDIPIGIERHYQLELEDSSLDADGMNFDAAKLFNNQYPGPWIEACWGDTLVVNVTNKLRYNGTSIHWHGIRQNQTMHMDGVNGIIQCPIAPQDYMVYKFPVTQYGSSWYHSHYSVQYADGAVGPITFHGPTSAEWHEAISPPLIMTDWGHNSAFDAVHTGLEYKDILLNGRGNVTNFNNTTPNTTHIKPPYHITFEAPQTGQPIKKYLLRIINTSIDSTFIFSIDNHMLQIVSSDFVPIQPYQNTSVLVGIGQRYNVIVEANPVAYNESSPLPTDGNYWIRTWVSPCTGNQGGTLNYERTGILRYDGSSTTNPSSQHYQNVSKDCSDERYQDLHPIVPWQVGGAVNNNYTDGNNFDLWVGGNVTSRPFPLATWTLGLGADGYDPMRVNYSDPTFFHFDNTGPWNRLWRVVPENFGSEDWVYLVVKGLNGFYGAHPIHLHGHDFALLEQSYDRTFDPNKMNLKLDNPPRRDVVLLPKGGYVVIAFKADNPGAWIVHCHIAFHISRGLGLQIMERQSDANTTWPKETSPAIREAERVCTNWDSWHGNENNWAVPPDKCKETDKELCFQDDSGV